MHEDMIREGNNLMEEYWGNMLNAHLANPVDFIPEEVKADITVEVDIADLAREIEYEELLEASRQLGEGFRPSLGMLIALRDVCKTIVADGRSVKLVVNGLTAYADSLLSQHASRLAEEGRDLSLMRDHLRVNLNGSLGRREVAYLRQLSGASELTFQIGW